MSDPVMRDLDRHLDAIDAAAHETMERRVTEALSDQFDDVSRRPWNTQANEYPDARAIGDIITSDDTDWLALIVVAYAGLGDDTVEGTVARMMERGRLLWTSDRLRRAWMRSALRLSDVQGFEP